MPEPASPGPGSPGSGSPGSGSLGPGSPGSASPVPAPPGPAVPGPPGRNGAIGLRLALAFLGVALAAIALLAGLTAVFSAAGVSDRTNSGAAADLGPVLDLAGRTGADVQIRDAEGRPVSSSPGFAGQPGAQLSTPVVVHGQRVGAAVIRFRGSGLGGAEENLRS